MARKNKKQLIGLGDVVESITEATGIKKVVEVFSDVTGIDCGCDDRRDKLNKLLPIRFKSKRCFTLQEYNWYDDYYKNRSLHLVSENELKLIVKLHEDIFNWKVNNLCHNCSGSANIIRGMIERLDKVYLSYNE